MIINSKKKRIISKGNSQKIKEFSIYSKQNKKGNEIIKMIKKIIKTKKRSPQRRQNEPSLSLGRPKTNTAIASSSV